MTDPVIELLSSEFMAGSPRDAYAWMRRNSPVHFDGSSGLWAIATYDLVQAAGRDPVTFSNAGGSRPDVGPLPWMIDMDGAAHAKRRKLVGHAFAPRRIRAGEEQVARICEELIDRVCERGACDFVRDLAAPLPMIVIGDMLGVPPQDRDDLLRWSDDMLASLGGSPDNVAAAAVAFGEYVEYARRAIAARRRRPTDDLISVLVHAEVDGSRLDDDEIVFETLLLLVGGDETTRHVLAGGTLQLLAEPAERRKLAGDLRLLGSAVEEMLRWVSPIKSMARTVTRDVELGGRHLPAGEKVLLLYESANFDESRFEEPERFRVERSPNDHLAFGVGPHFCLGAGLARLEVRAMLERLLRRLPDLALADGAPSPHGAMIAEMPITFTPSPPVLTPR